MKPTQSTEDATVPHWNSQFFHGVRIRLDNESKTCDPLTFL